MENSKQQEYRVRFDSLGRTFTSQKPLSLEEANSLRNRLVEIEFKKVHVLVKNSSGQLEDLALADTNGFSYEI